MIITNDEFGRYRLNDLHKASGGESKDKPANWLRLANVQELIEIENQQINEDLTAQKRAVETHKALVTVEGANGGTFATKKLVYAYATWISAR